MRCHSELLDKQVDFSEEGERVDELESDVEEAAQKHGDDECKYLIISD